MSALETTVDQPTLAGRATAHDEARALLGRVMGLVAVTIGFSALGAYLGRDLGGATGLVLFIGAFACIVGLNVAAAKSREQLAIGLLFGLGLLLGLAVAPVIADYANADPSALWQSAGATAAFVAAAGAYGYATRRDLSSWGRTLFWALLGLIAFGIVAIFVSIPNENVIYAVAGLVIFGAFTIFDFNRLRRSTPGATDSELRSKERAMSDNIETAILAGGCFWGVQELLRHRDGVVSTRVGYTGGENENPTYRNHPGHAEAVEIVFDPERISYRDILELFFQIHDPTTKNRQGNDIGSDYRSEIFYSDDQQRQVAADTIADVDASGLWPGKVVTEISASVPFWVAEAEHQDYLQRYPSGYNCHFPRSDWKLPHREAAA